MDILGVAGVAVIAVICYLIGAGLKAWDKFDDRKIPVLMGVCGAILGVLAFYFAPNVIPADDIITAIAIGIVSGFTATAINQVYRQSQKGDVE